MHIQNHTDKQACTLARANLDYALFGRQCPYHARIKRDAQTVDGLFFGQLAYVATSGDSTVWQDAALTITVDQSGYAKRAQA